MGIRHFDHIGKCKSENRTDQTSAADLDGTLLISRDAFEHFMLAAIEAGSIVRAILLLASSPFVYVAYTFFSESVGIQILIFISFAGLKVRVIEIVARSVFPRFYADDIHPDGWRVFGSFGRRYVVTANPRIMVEPFVKKCTLKILRA